MKLSKFIQQFILECICNWMKHRTIRDVVLEKFNIKVWLATISAIRNKVDRVRAEGIEIPLETKESFADNSWEISVSKNSRITSLEELIEHCKIDLNVWDIDRHVINKWEVWAKDEDGKIVTEPLYQIKAWLKKKSEQYVDYEEVLKGIEPIDYTYTFNPNIDKDGILVISDEHVWLNPDWQYWYKYSKEILMSKIEDVAQAVATRNIDHLYVIFCGDWLDWRQWQTTRWGHKLPQTYSSPEAFDIYVTFKVNLIKELAKYVHKILVKNVCNSNHWWDFEEVANIAVGKLLDNKDFDYEIYKKFINHFTVWDRTFIVTHWKDSIDMRYWLPLNLNDKTIIYINNYIRANKINSKYVTVIKWDLHQSAYNKTQTFDYHNFPSFAPPSKWVQNNFGDTYSWFGVLEFTDWYIARYDYDLHYNKA